MLGEFLQETELKCPSDEKNAAFVPSRFRLNMFGKNVPCQLLRMNFENKPDSLTTTFRFNCPPLPEYVPVELR